MNKFNIDAIAMAIGFAFSAGAIAESMPKEYQCGEDGFTPTLTESPMRELG